MIFYGNIKSHSQCLLFTSVIYPFHFLDVSDFNFTFYQVWERFMCLFLNYSQSIKSFFEGNSKIFNYLFRWNNHSCPCVQNLNFWTFSFSLLLCNQYVIPTSHTCIKFFIRLPRTYLCFLHHILPVFSHYNTKVSSW